MKRLVLSLMLLVLVLPAIAQFPGTQYPRDRIVEIVRADYGWGNRWVDVTDRVRALIQGGTLNFQVHADHLRVDPLPGRPKLLRLQIRESDGDRRMIEFREGEYVNLNIRDNNVWNPAGNLIWGRPAAPREGACFYRDAGYNSDSFCLAAGQSASSLPRGFNDQIRAIQMFGNTQVTVFRDLDFAGPRETFFSSVPNLWYVESGQWNDQISSIRVERAAGNWGSGGLRITRAEWAFQTRVMDVTQRLNSLIQGDRLSLRVSNDSMGGDPAEGRPKILNVWYVFNGRPGRVRVYENNILDLPGAVSDNYYQAGLHVTRARYGAEGHYIDVTQLLDSQVQGDRLSLRVSNENLGGDPARGMPKNLVVFYTFNGRQDRVIANEGEYLDIGLNPAGRR